ncbi:MAG: hypothetical protein HKN82_11535 [Akkermansiaceae bacterium]|nr:hypothetical protein [Akkermansiaceae bacterium]NNM28274.1 hypothetical protein [Akkermansiaceae bacterium]
MKFIVVSFLLSAAVAMADPSDYVNFVRQIQEDSGVAHDVGVDPIGSMLSAEGVGPGGSEFELWSIHTESSNEYLLDTKYVSSFAPDSAIQIITGDPYRFHARTRADQPFTVIINVSGLVTIPATNTPPGDPAIPNSARQVMLEHEVYNYPGDQHSLSGITNPAGTRTSGMYGNNELPLQLNFAATNLSGPDLTKVKGEEIWTVHSTDEWTREGRKKGGFRLKFSGEGILASKKLQVWPVADATISGIDSSVRYSEVPNVTVDLNDLYPSSSTQVRIFLGSPGMANPDYIKIRDGFVPINDSIPQNRTLFLNNINDYFTEEGAYTMEVIHTTPFGTELLTHLYPIKVDRTVEFRGGLYTVE